MPKLTDTQSMLLAHAAQHDDGSALPLPATLANTDRATKALAALGKRGFLEKRETSTAVQAQRTDGDLRYGYYLTLAGYAGSTSRRQRLGTRQPPAPPQQRHGRARRRHLSHSYRARRALPSASLSRQPAGCRARRARR